LTRQICHNTQADNTEGINVSRSRYDIVARYYYNLWKRLIGSNQSTMSRSKPSNNGRSLGGSDQGKSVILYLKNTANIFVPAHSCLLPFYTNA